MKNYNFKRPVPIAIALIATILFGAVACSPEQVEGNSQTNVTIYTDAGSIQKYEDVEIEMLRYDGFLQFTHEGKTYTTRADYILEE